MNCFQSSKTRLRCCYTNLGDLLGEGFLDCSGWLPEDELWDEVGGGAAGAVGEGDEPAEREVSGWRSLGDPPVPPCSLLME